MNARRDGAAYAASRRTERKLAIVDGHRLAYVREGSGQPTVVFLSGAGMDIDSWFLVHPAAAALGTAIAYDRPGVGGSDRADAPQPGSVIVAALRSLLQQAGTPPPYLIVGHSLGGLYANLFARHHPADVCGVVLVDSASPGDVASQPPPGAIARAFNGASGIVDRLRGRARFSEVDAVEETLGEIAAAPPFPDVPLIVVTGSKRMPLVPEPAFQAHVANQRELVNLSPRGRQVLAAHSGHFPQMHDPEVVIDAIREVAASCRPLRPLP